MKHAKKLWALVLALVMVLALGVTASATATEPTATTMDFQISYVGHGAPGSVSEHGDPLAGGVFVLKQGDNIVQRATSDANGVVTFTGLAAGTYTLEQETAPLGYEKATCNADNRNPNAPSVQIKIESGRISGVDNYNGIYATFNYGDGTMYQWPGGDKNTYPNNYTTLEFKSEYSMTTVTIPFTKEVKLGGNTAPDKQTFELEIFEIGNSNKNEYQNVKYTAKVETNGAGTYTTGKLVITGPANEVAQYINEGFYVREKNTKADKWTYSDAVWHVTFENTNNGPKYTIYPATKQTSANGDYYEDGAAVTQMTFTNTYTQNVTYTRPAQPTETKIGSPKTFDAGIGLYAVSALLCVTGSAWLVGKKHK